MKWRVAKSLLTLRDQVNAMAPDRNKSSDGTIGDASHQSRTSDHNPNADNVVTAIDITNDPAHGVNARNLAELLLRSQDPRIKYVISNREIFSSPGYSRSKKAWTWRPYTGANAHTKHVHISVLGDKELYDNTDPWPVEMMSRVESSPSSPSPSPIGLISGNFETCMQVIEKWEGGFDNDPDDPGGPTNMGVTQADLARWRDHPVSVDDVRNLTRDEARQIFRSLYWEPINGDRLLLPAAQMCLDAAILTGVGRGGRDLQEALNRQNANLVVDGVVGSKTIAACQSADMMRLVPDFGDIAETYLRGRPGFPKYGKGWLNRLNDVRVVATNLAKAPPQQQPAGGRKMAISLTEVASILQQVLDLVQAIEKKKAGATGGTAPGTETSQSVDLQKILELFKAVTGDTTKPLGPVNNALGETIGEFLNGKKSAIGIIGALLTSLLGQASAGPGTALGGLLTQIPALAGLSGPAMPIFLAMAAWGVLGKLEKWSGNAAPSQKP